jgi:hypothetical protein
MPRHWESVHRRHLRARLRTEEEEWAHLKRVNEHWSKRSYGAYKANEYRVDTLIPVIRNVLESNEPDYWQPLEPDIVLAIYPEIYFPFLPPKWELVSESEKISRMRETHQLVKDLAGQLPDDPFTVITLIDAYNFGDTSGYSGVGPALILHASRWQVKNFCDQLQGEYELFCAEYGTPATLG